MKKKKILFTAYSLDLGGIETSLINLLNNINYNNYDVTLILEHKQGIFLDVAPKEVKIIEYKLSTNKFVLLRKIKNRIKLILWKMKLFHKYDFSCSFATYSIPGSHLARAASLNNTLWMHANYYVDYGKNEEKLKNFLNSVSATEFKRLVFVSHENLVDVTSHYNGILEKSIVCNNFINGDEIIEKSKEPISWHRGDTPLLINVGRHEEHQKKLSRIISASARLIKEGYKFQILLLGDGPNHNTYKEMVKKLQLEEYILFLGRKKNPFPYYKIADATILSSEYEGYPVVFLESMVMNIPLISTKVSDYKDLENKFGIFGECSEEGVYISMKKFLNDGFNISEKFDYNMYNQDIKNKLLKMFNDSDLMETRHDV